MHTALLHCCINISNWFLVTDLRMKVFKTDWWNTSIRQATIVWNYYVGSIYWLFMGKIRLILESIWTATDSIGLVQQKKTSTTLHYNANVLLLVLSSIYVALSKISECPRLINLCIVYKPYQWIKNAYLWHLFTRNTKSSDLHRYNRQFYMLVIKYSQFFFLDTWDHKGKVFRSFDWAIMLPGSTLWFLLSLWTFEIQYRSIKTAQIAVQWHFPHHIRSIFKLIYRVFYSCRQKWHEL